MRTRLAAPWFRSCLSNPAILLLGLIGVPEDGVAGTGRLVSSWMSRAPAIDGTIDPAEWAEATEVDFGGGSYLRVGNDGRTLYLAVRHNSYPFSHFLDTMILFFDDEGGAAPQLDDGVWSNPACHSDPELGEGEIWFEHTSRAVRYFEWVDPGGAASFCLDQAIASRLAFTSTAGVLTPTNYEIAIPLDGTGPLNAGPGSRLAVSIRLIDDSSGGLFCYPNCSIVPSSFRNLVLASGGCNTGPQSFGSGDPLVGLPLDWTSQLSGNGESWQQSLPPFFGNPVFCDANDTGGSGAAACVSDFFYTSTGAQARLRMPLALAGQTEVAVRARAVFRVDPNGAGPAEQLLFGLERQDGSTSTLLRWEGQDQSGIVTLPLSLIGSPPTELLFLHSTDSGGGLEGGYAQIDDVEILCGPILFADDFESGLSTHWPATVP